MGGGIYSSNARLVRTNASGLHAKNNEEIFTNRGLNSSMNPCDVIVREARDSEEHPNSLAIILALDVTGSMGDIPNYIVKDGLPKIMDSIIQCGIKDPQVLFMGIGDHECDNAPLQVGQFESNDKLLDKWLIDLFLEGGGGGNGGESYLLAWYFAQRTITDCFEKRKEKGFLFTIGDEPCLKYLPGNSCKKIMGNRWEYRDETAISLLKKAQEKYHVFHLNIKEGYGNRFNHIEPEWKELIGDNFINVDDHRDISKIIPEIIGSNYKVKESSPSVKIKPVEVIL